MHIFLHSDKRQPLRRIVVGILYIKSWLSGRCNLRWFLISGCPSAILIISIDIIGHNHSIAISKAASELGRGEPWPALPCLSYIRCQAGHENLHELDDTAKRHIVLLSTPFSASLYSLRSLIWAHSLGIYQQSSTHAGTKSGFTTFSYSSLHFTYVHITSHHFTSLHFTTHHFTSLTFISLHITLLHFISQHITSPHFTYVHITSHHFTSLHFTTHHFTSLHLLSYHFTSLYFTSFHNTSLHFTSPYEFGRWRILASERSYIYFLNKSPTRCNKFPIYYPDVCSQLNMFRALSRPSSGAQWLQ